MMSWNDLSYHISEKKDKQKWILHPQDGSASPHELLALMGPSGSGKTSLLNALAGRLPITKGACFSASVKVNGVSKHELPCPFADLSAYVEQEDVLFALSTAQETLDFTSRLRLPSATPQDERTRRIEEVLRQLGLYHVRNTNVGGSSFNGALRGLSGGERKRLSIALELLHKPKIVFLDEPTSGLDSYQALNVMEKLCGLTSEGSTVVVSIHQPRSSIFALFNKVYLMAEGKPVYVGSADTVVDYFSVAGYDLPPKFNPADFLIDLVSIDQRDPEQQEKTQGQLLSLQTAWASSKEAKQIRSDTASAAVAQADEILKARLEKPAGHHAFLMPFVLLLRRGWREQMRDKLSVAIKTLFTLFISVIFALVYFRLGHSQNNIQDRVGLVFFLTMNQAFGSVIGCSQVIPRQLVVVNRDRANRLYHIFPFYLSSMAVMLPIETVPQILTNVVLFFMTNLGGSFWIFCGVLTLENLVGVSLGMFLSALFKNVQMASQLAPVVVILFLVFGGQMINEGSVPVYFVWLKEISFIRYAFKAAVVNELEGASFECEAGASVCVSTGEQVIAQLNFDEDNAILNCVMILLAIFLALNVLAILTLVAKKPRFLTMQVAPVATPAESEVKGGSA